LRYRVLPVLVGAAVLCVSHSAYAATLSVDDDHADCPAAAYSSIQAAVDAAAPNDTVVICPGTYAEGSGAVGTNALTIEKNLTLRGAGADLVTITPRSTVPVGGRIMEDAPDLRNGVGDIIAVDGTPSQPLVVHIQGVTVDGWDPQGRPVAVEAGIVFLDAKGSVERSRVTNIVTSEGNNAYLHAGGWRGTQPGIGIAQTSTALYSPVDGARRLVIDHTRIDKYNKVGVLIDSAQNDTPPLTRSGTTDWGVITASQIVGRTECIEYQGTGNCSSVGLLTSGPLFGQDGLRVTSGSYATVESSLISQNLVNGEGAPARNSTTNNANLTLGAGVRYVDAQLTKFSPSTNLVVLSQISHSNITDNAYGAMNVQADGTTAQVGDPDATIFEDAEALLKAEGNWWGLQDRASTNPGPAVAPTTNPQIPENPVNGTQVNEAATGGRTSTAVDFYPYRDGNAANPDTGEYPVLTAPIPMSDAPPTVQLNGPASAARGATVTLTASPADDFGVKRVRFTVGTTTLGTVTLPPYTLTSTIPEDAACGSARSYTAIATDSLGQTASATKSVTVTCSAPQGPAPQDNDQQSQSQSNVTPAAVLGAPTVAWRSWPSPLRGSGVVTFAPSASAGLRSVAVYLGDRLVCTVTGAPYSCRITVSGADVGGQSLRLVITDARGASAEAARSITVAKFRAEMKLSVKTKALRRGLARRTISGHVNLPDAVSRRQGCNGTVTLVIKRGGHSVLNQQVRVSKACRFSRSLTTKSAKQSFTAKARFGGNAVLASADGTRRFS
jgi:Bacterial Ig domain